MMIFCESSAAADAQYVVDADVGLPDRTPHFDPLRPLDLDRRDRKKQRSRKIPLAADARLRNGFFGGHIAKFFGKGRRRGRFDGNEIDRSGHRRFQAVNWETRDGSNAGFARGKLRPVIFLAGAKRCHDAHAGDDNDWPAEFVA